jgi:hypothetical protein
VLVPSRLEDPSDKVMWVDDHWATLRGGRASVELVDGNIYLAVSLRNVGAGIAVLQAWHPTPDPRPGQPHLGGYRSASPVVEGEVGSPVPSCRCRAAGPALRV